MLSTLGPRRHMQQLRGRTELGVKVGASELVKSHSSHMGGCGLTNDI